MKIISLLLICFLYTINCELSIIGPSDLNSQYANRPIDIVFRKMSDTSNFYVHGEVIFENITHEHTACQDLGVLPTNTNQNQYSENFKILLAYIGNCSYIPKGKKCSKCWCFYACIN